MYLIKLFNKILNLSMDRVIQYPSHLLSLSHPEGEQVLIHNPFPSAQHCPVGIQLVHVQDGVVVGVDNVDVDVVVVGLARHQSFLLNRLEIFACMGNPVDKVLVLSAHCT